MSGASPLLSSNAIRDKAEALERLQLRMVLAARLATLDIHVRECAALEDALSRFATEYFSAVGEKARLLCSLLAPEEQRAMHKSHHALQDQLQELSRTRATRLKQTYRRLARGFHPDYHAASDKPRATSMMQTLNAAYTNRDMATLLRLEIEHLVAAGNGRQELAALAEKLAHCEALIGSYTAEREAMEQSPLFVLHERTMLARLAGEDFIENVLSGLKNQIRQKQKQAA